MQLLERYPNPKGHAHWEPYLEDESCRLADPLKLHRGELHVSLDHVCRLSHQGSQHTSKEPTGKIHKGCQCSIRPGWNTTGQCEVTKLSSFSYAVKRQGDPVCSEQT